MKTNTIIFVLFAAIFAACTPSTPKEEKPKPETFTSPEIGWTIEIPAGFKLLSQNRSKENEQKGRAVMENATGQKIETGKMINLVNFQKNQFNSFNSTLQPYDESIDGDYLQTNRLTKEAIYDTYTHQKIKVDTASFTENVSGQIFQGFSIKIYGPNGDVIMKQLMLSQLRKGYDFGVNINYNNEADYQLLWNAFKNAKFSN